MATDVRTPALGVEQGLSKLATYPFQILSWVDPEGYPVDAVVDRALMLLHAATRGTS